MSDLSTYPIIDILSSPQELRNICNHLNLKFDHSFGSTMVSMSPMSKEFNSTKSEPMLYFKNSGKSLNISNIKQFLI